MKKLYYDYEKLENLNFDEEIDKINEADVVNIRFNQRNKRMLFLLGILFAANKRITLMNHGELNINDENKSYDKMVTQWTLNAKGPSIKNYGDVNSNNIFLICPVRKATEEQIKRMKAYIAHMETSGYKIHYPDRDTNQVNPIGYRICRDNGRALGKAGSIHIFYDNTSTGTLFDLGMVYYFNKSLKIVNQGEIQFRNDDFGDTTIQKMLKKTQKVVW
jgi:hypothetical protein